MTINMLDPVGERDIELKEIAERVGELDGMIVGLLNNSKPNTDIFFEKIRGQLSDEFDISKFVYANKSGANSPIGEDIVSKMVDCDVVINGIGDCGGCTSWTVHDGITLESLGVPTATITTTAFIDLANFDLISFGMVNLPLVVFQHPLSGLKPEEVNEKAENAYDLIKTILTTPKSELVKKYDATKG